MSNLQAFCSIYNLSIQEREKIFTFFEKIFLKIINEPNNKKYQNLNLLKIEKKIQKCPESIELLYNAGFTKTNENRLMFDTKDMNKLTVTYETLLSFKKALYEDNDDTLNQTDKKIPKTPLELHMNLLLSQVKSCNKALDIIIEDAKNKKRATEQKTLSLTRNELLIYGYMREVQLLLNNDEIIPTEIVNLCYSFYLIPLKILSFYSGFSISEVNPFNITNTNSKSWTKIVNQKGLFSDDNNIRLHSKPWCYIPYISSSLYMDKNEYLDGIIGLYQKKPYDSYDSYPTLLLFETNKIKLENETIKYDAYNSSLPIPQPNKEATKSRALTGYLSEFVYCGNKHGIIYHDECMLYQLKLNEIDLKLNNFIFKEIIQDNNTIFDIRSDLTADSYSSLSMRYLQRQDKIFAINIFQPTFGGAIFSHNSNIITSSYIKCGIFDLNKGEWKQIKSYKYNHFIKLGLVSKTMQEFMVGISFNNLYDRDCQYIVSNIGQTAKYDMNKNEWFTIIEDLQMQFTHNQRPNVWFDDNPHILYCIANKKTKSENDEEFQGFLDLRDNHTKWIQDGDFVTKNEDVHMKLCTFF